MRIVPLVSAILVWGALTGAAHAKALTQLRWLAPGADAGGAGYTRAGGVPETGQRTKRRRYRHRGWPCGVFRTPELLGGQAARVGLSCDACHINGRNNPTFYIDGVSGLPGTVDVHHGCLQQGPGRRHS